jgi:hypothetical protein
VIHILEYFPLAEIPTELQFCAVALKQLSKQNDDIVIGKKTCDVFDA